MSKISKSSIVFGAVLALLMLPSFAGAAEIQAVGSALAWSPDFEHGSADLRISGPDGFSYHRVFAAGESLSFSLAALENAPVGGYTWSLLVTSAVSDDFADRLRAARAAGGDLAAIKADAGFRSESLSGHFYYDGLGFVVPGSETERLSDVEAPAKAAELPTKAQVITTDLIVQGSTCVGQDCVNGESFGFDTLRLKENNLRIKAQDTSNSASFPSQDWQITFNDSSNGGANKFSIDDIDAGRTPFTIEANAPNHSLYVDDGGRIGFGTSTPVVELHVVNGDSPTLRLEQNGSSGFTAQTFDVAANETNFFVRDATNGSRIPFKIIPNAPTNSLYVAASGSIGLGTASPETTLHAKVTAGAPKQMLKLTNNDRVFAVFEDTSFVEAGNTLRWNLGTRANNGTVDGFEISRANSGATEMVIESDGDLTISGRLLVCTGTNASCSPSTTYPDYVFKADYELMPLDELAEFIGENGHLPNVPTVEDVSKSGINMTELQLKILEKVEELTLYTLSQQELIDAQSAKMNAQAAEIEALRKQLSER